VWAPKQLPEGPRVVVATPLGPIVLTVQESRELAMEIKASANAAELGRDCGPFPTLIAAQEPSTNAPRH
jgi:hypothetical protein